MAQIGEFAIDGNILSSWHGNKWIFSNNGNTLFCIDPYRNPISLGEVDGCFLDLIISGHSVSKKKLRKSLWNYYEKNLWEDINMIEVYTCTYNKRNQLVGSYWKILLVPKNYLSWSCFLQLVVMFFSACVDTKQTEYEADLAISFMIR